MRRHSKASTAGSTQRQATGLGRIFRGAFATRGALLAFNGSGAPKARRLAIALSLAILASLASSASPASASKAHLFKERLGSAAQPALIEGRGVAIDQSSGDLLVLDAGLGSSIKRFKPDGTPDNFSALGSNMIDGKEGPDATPQNGLSFSSPSESQIAVDNSGGITNGNIYVTQSSPNLINIFSETGAYLGQLTEAGLTATSFSEACGVAVDSSGAVYVGDYSGGIHKFVPSANPPVNADNTATFTTTTQPCTLAAGAGPTAGFLFPAEFNGEVLKIDSASGELKYSVVSGSHTTVSVDPGTGHVFAAADSTLEEFDASGALSATKLSATKHTESIRGIAIKGSSGEIYLSAQIDVSVYDDPIVTVPDATTTAATNNTGVRATLNGTVNPDGVELSECFFEYGETFFYGQSAPCAESPGAIGSGTSDVAVHADITNLQPNNTHYFFRLVAKNPQGEAQVTGEQQFQTADTVITTAASGLSASAATLNGTVNPDTLPMTECLFEWGLTTSYGNTAPCVPNAAGIGSGTSPVPVSAAISGLHTGTVYHFRLKAANANGPILAGDESLQSAGPRIVDTWAEDVLITEANLKAEINPEGSATTYHFEYGPTEAYGSESGELNVASDSSVHTVFLTLTNLQPGTEYHYRVIATNADGTNEGPDHVIRTFRPFSAETDCPNQANRYGAGAALPDCRAYEMVSPLDKNNGDISSLWDNDSVFGTAIASRTQSAPSGDKLAYSSYRAFADAQSVPWSSQYIAQRRADGWQTHSINQPGGAPLFNGGLSMARAQYQGFSEDLCQAWMKSFFAAPLSEATVPGVSNLYRREDRLCGPERFEAMAPIVIPPGEEFTPYFEGASADGSHAIFDTESKLVPEGTEGEFQLYESVEGAAPRLVCILPDGEAWQFRCTAGSGHVGPLRGIRTGAISEDGQRIFWTDEVGEEREGKIYVRIGGTETLAVSQAGEEEAGTTGSYFWGAALDGSRAIFTTGNPRSPSTSRSRLFAFDVDGEATEPIAAGVYGVLGISENARRVYFLSQEALPGSGQNSEGDEAIAGQPNLYFYDADAGGGTSTFIDTLAAEDFVPGNIDNESSPVARGPAGHVARITPDGLHVAFASLASLTGYDNKNSNPFDPLNRLAYVYDAQSDQLICASCNPSGARGQEEVAKDAFLDGKVIPISAYNETSLEPSRMLSDDGLRLFFESVNALDPRDSNGKVDVYEWEKLGAGDCDAGDSRFAPSAHGCIELISGGTSAFDAEFAEATPSGDDVFFFTTSSLVAQDYGLRDVYDARAGGGFPLPPEAPECVGDACQSVPAPPNDPTPASAGFKGAGNPVPRKAHRRRCRARKHAAKHAKRHAKKSAKSCRRAKRGAGR